MVFGRSVVESANFVPKAAAQLGFKRAQAIVRAVAVEAEALCYSGDEASEGKGCACVFLTAETCLVKDC